MIEYVYINEDTIWNYNLQVRLQVTVMWRPLGTSGEYVLAGTCGFSVCLILLDMHMVIPG